METGFIVSGRVRYHPALGPFLVNIGCIQQHPENYNLGDVEEVAESILINGMYDVIKAQRSTGYIIAGNTTWEACYSLDADIIPAVFHDVSDTEALRMMATDNETARKARRDPSALLRLLAKVEAETGTTAGTGVTPQERDVLTAVQNIPLRESWATDAETVEFRVDLPKRLHRAYRHVTREADTEPEAFELLLRLAGWEE